MKASILVYSSLALDDITRIFDWYEEQQKGLGDRFLDYLNKTEETLKKIPLGFQLRHKTTREALINPFPYLIIYTVEDGVISVNAIFPTKTNPTKKYIRISKRKKRKK